MRAKKFATLAIFDNFHFLSPISVFIFFIFHLFCKISKINTINYVNYLQTLYVIGTNKSSHGNVLASGKHLKFLFCAKKTRSAATIQDPRGPDTQAYVSM